MTSIFKLFLSITILFLMGCASENSESSTDSNSESVTSTPVPAENKPASPSKNTDFTTPPDNTKTSDVFHYICSKGCAGSGSNTAGNCPVCGTALTHNQAFHNEPGQTPTITTTPGTDANAANTQNIQTEASSAQNAAGVYHYTCPSGCAGGAGSAVACSSCGTTLVHNQAYHQ